MLNLCRTREIKLARHLQRVAPDLVPAEEPAEGFGSLLQSGDPMLRFQLRDLESRGRLPPTRSAASAPLFTGALKFVTLNYPGPGGGLAILPADIATCLAYAARAVPPIVRYANQYGRAAASVDPIAATLAPPRAARRFNDTSVKTWVDAFVRANGLPPNASAVVLLNPPGAVNTDADPAQGVLGYHGLASVPYSFVNVVGSGFALDDPSDQFALALSHEIAEMVVDPRADLSNPEVCDPCGPNCQTVWRGYFDAGGAYLATETAFPPALPFAFFINGIVQPPDSTACPAPRSACAYGPP
ncbi:MAG: hypothetical protein L3K15_02840 [Thermoplasmata archaeon]|nr:hypothetical protein [Thermoplasmata archaeon]